ncbi:MAG: hypothetical protein C3F06_09570 [Candidatus Methanoperedenaceae archaeon]|nr:MAG: hypothetical protein C3F06_09570 [Candidatus Methanoperedenaceae archaeon]
MELKRKTLLSVGCALVLALGLIILLVLLTALPISYFSIMVQKFILILIFIFSLITVPVILRKLNRLPNEKQILGWTFIGLGVEFMIFPFMLLIYIFNFSSAISMIIGVSIVMLSLIFGLSAGLMSIVMGISLVKRK